MKVQLNCEIIVDGLPGRALDSGNNEIQNYQTFLNKVQASNYLILMIGVNDLP